MADLWGKLELHHIVSRRTFRDPKAEWVLNQMGLAEEARGNKVMLLKDASLLSSLISAAGGTIGDLLARAGFGTVAHSNGEPNYNGFLLAQFEIIHDKQA
ncbi:MAG: hypothetical protein AAF366_16220 [Pseudomonadota bacterium]